MRPEKCCLEGCGQHLICTFLFSVYSASIRWQLVSLFRHSLDAPLWPIFSVLEILVESEGSYLLVWNDIALWGSR